MTDVTPAGWYPDPAGGGGQRYWDGATWTGHVAPPAEATWPAAPAFVPPTPSRAPVWPWIVGIGFGLLFVIAVLLAIAIPTFLGAKSRAEDREAQAAVRAATTAVFTRWSRDGYDEVPPERLQEVVPSLSFTTAPSLGPTEVSYYFDSLSATVAAKSRSGKCWVYRMPDEGGGLLRADAGSLPKGQPCHAAIAAAHMTPEDF